MWGLLLDMQSLVTPGRLRDPVWRKGCVLCMRWSSNSGWSGARLVIVTCVYNCSYPGKGLFKVAQRVSGQTLQVPRQSGSSVCKSRSSPKRVEMRGKGPTGFVVCLAYPPASLQPLWKSLSSAWDWKQNDCMSGVGFAFLHLPPLATSAPTFHLAFAKKY